MHFFRHTIALLLLGALTLGGVLSPLAHLSYMAVSDAYAPVSSHSGGHHGAHAASLPSDGPALQAPHEGHVSCPYMELYATPLLGVSAQPVAVLAADCPVATLQECARVSRRASLLFSYTVRGPPFAA